MKNQIPVHKNEYYEMDIHSMGHEGEGVGRIENFTVFVPHALPGDRVKVKIVKTKNTYAYGKLIEIVNPSEHRVDPVCPSHIKCGGCQLQHLAYSEQLELKKQKVVDNLQRIGKLEDVVVHDTIGMEKPMRYRNKVQFPVGRDENTGKVKVGFYAPRSHDIIETDVCQIQHEINDSIIEKLKLWMEENNVSAYQEKTRKGLVRHIFTRVGFATGEIMVVLVANGAKIPNPQQFIDAMRSVNDKVKSIILNVNTKATNVVLGQENRLLWGTESIIDYIGDVKFHISPMSFYQVNPVQTEVLYNKALECAQLNGDETVFDLYCGIGTISLFLARNAKKVVGVEIVAEAIEDAKQNAALNDIHNVEFHVGAAEEVIPKLYNQGYTADVVVVDPPRKGCDEALLDTIAKMQVDRIVYVSCNPSTLARDLRYLEDRGYKTIDVQPVDMFPHTAHVETVILMTRCGQNDK
ncbi:23S rRNA (uracil(1939)-C(5))-methyltransferase RlmD [Petroclostridium sp. X23]|uniref:23S rRNA (uracil(1939)-C(5))-methyltransferase RlmD n=1 Tax=Petroclostridium sp. X23 TaxID=3045146 RepID=UPI0024ADA11B|nr:23S rRNA (uracil(1939)-C(5))-methyltransferase RlmD [Petroclostridium sp. X23]WHH57717.1 23S rRNA (uracil(1939)-C(5))-methyltransferase RlmD [Petroclostridium sp. X23]